MFRCSRTGEYVGVDTYYYDGSPERLECGCVVEASGDVFDDECISDDDEQPDS